ncbi:MAG: hypothetical protein II264_04590 [Ruminococcus sp.]|nr:hypothetical protein [Ruminococcus sp.]
MELEKINRENRAKLALAMMSDDLSEQQNRTLWGLVEHGDISGAFIGLGRILRRKENSDAANVVKNS